MKSTYLDQANNTTVLPWYTGQGQTSHSTTRPGMVSAEIVPRAGLDELPYQVIHLCLEVVLIHADRIERDPEGPRPGSLRTAGAPSVAARATLHMAGTCGNRTHQPGF